MRTEDHGFKGGLDYITSPSSKRLEGDFILLDIYPKVLKDKIVWCKGFQNNKKGKFGIGNCWRWWKGHRFYYMTINFGGKEARALAFPLNYWGPTMERFPLKPFVQLSHLVPPCTIITQWVFQGPNIILQTQPSRYNSVLPLSNEPINLNILISKWGWQQYSKFHRAVVKVKQ